MILRRRVVPITIPHMGAAPASWIAASFTAMHTDGPGPVLATSLPHKVLIKTPLINDAIYFLFYYYV